MVKWLSKGLLKLTLLKICVEIELRRPSINFSHYFSWFDITSEYGNVAIPKCITKTKLPYSALGLIFTFTLQSVNISISVMAFNRIPAQMFYFKAFSLFFGHKT